MKKILSIIVLTIGIAANGFANSPVETYGRLYTSGNKIVGEKSGGEAVQLKGPSMQWSSTGWGSDAFFRKDAVYAMVDGWNARVIRASLGIAFNKGVDHAVSDGYNIDPIGNWERVKTVADAAVERGVYVIIDWHSHTAHDPEETALAIDFFTSDERAGQYGNNPAVIFEIYNEPEDDVTWTQVKDYANAVIAAIRGRGFNNLILIGTPYWTSQPHLIKNDDIDDTENNFAAAFHFYADEHRIERTHYFTPAPSQGTYRSAVEDALDNGVPVFVTEWGTNDASVGGTLNFEEADKWHAYLDSNKISSCAWGIMAGDGNVLYFWTNDGNPLDYTTSDAASWTDSEGMTPHGKYVYKWLTGYDPTPKLVKPPYPQYVGSRTSIAFPPRLETIDDAWADGKSEVSYQIDEGIAHITFKVDKGAYKDTPYIGAGFSTDVSGCGHGISYTYKGSSHVLRTEQSDVKNYAYHMSRPAARTAADWVTLDIPWTFFKQPAWNTVPVSQDHTAIETILWYVDGDGKEGEIWVKDVECLEEFGAVPVRHTSRKSQSNVPQLVKISGRIINVNLTQNGGVDVFDIKGKKVRALKLTSGNHTIRMNDLPKGMYVVRARDGKTFSQTVKVMIK